MNHPIQKSFLVFLLSLFLYSCVFKKKTVESNAAVKATLMEMDRAFSKMSEISGMKTAFMQYIDSNGVLLRPGTLPLIGGNAIDYISQGNDSSYIMTWDPNGVNVAESGELGYTYGVYSVKPSGTDTILHGTYVTIWKKQPDGKWKFILDTGNEGTGE